MEFKVSNCIFIGNFREKRFIESYQTYKDVVEIDDVKEKDFLITLDSVLKQMQIRHDVFLPITKNVDNTTTLFITLEESIPFGSYWFQVIYFISFK